MPNVLAALELAVLTILRPHFRILGGASLVPAEELESLATLSPRDEAGQRRVRTMLRRKVMAQHVDRPGWLHVLPVATLRIASSQIDMAWMEREVRSSLVIGVKVCSVEPQCEMRDDEREVLFFSSDDNHKRQRFGGSRYFADKMKIHRLNHKAFLHGARQDCRDATSSKAQDYITSLCSYCGGSLLMWERVLLLRMNAPGHDRTLE